MDTLATLVERRSYSRTPHSVTLGLKVFVDEALLGQTKEAEVSSSPSLKIWSPLLALLYTVNVPYRGLKGSQPVPQVLAVLVHDGIAGGQGDIHALRNVASSTATQAPAVLE